MHLYFVVHCFDVLNIMFYIEITTFFFYEYEIHFNIFINFF